jgi:hypothetical protein
MRIVVNHLTRMQPGYICVAGMERQGGRHVRPVLAGGRWTRAYLGRLEACSTSRPSWTSARLSHMATRRRWRTISLHLRLPQSLTR